MELFAPERHPREREEVARRVLSQTLLSGPQNPDSTKNTSTSTTNSRLSSSKLSTMTLSPMGVLRESKGQILHQVLELRQLEQLEEDYEPQHRWKADLEAGSEDDSVENVKKFHGYQRVDQQTAFLDVSGSARHIPVLSNLKAKEQHQSVIKKQSQMRAKRVDELQSFLQSQQQHTKQQLQLASLSNPKSHKPVARVDLGIDDGDDNRLEVLVAVIPTVNDHLAAVREVHQHERVLRHQQIQEKKLVAQLTRQQKLAFHQQQKRTLGRIKGVKRPSFLATLQLDNSATGEDTLTSGDDLIGGESFGWEAKELNQQQQKKKNQEESEHEHSGERKLQQLQLDKFLQSEGGGLHFGGGFRSNPNRKSTMPALITTTAKPTSRLGGDAMEAMSQELQQLLECGSAVSIQRK